MLDAHKKWLKKIFTAYAAADDSDDAILQADTMNVTEVLKMCNDAALVGATLNVRAIRSIFAYVQQEETLLEEDGGGEPKPPAVDEGARRARSAQQGLLLHARSLLRRAAPPLALRTLGARYPRPPLSHSLITRGDLHNDFVICGVLCV